MRCSHLSIYGDIVKISTSVRVRHMKCIIGEWEVIARESVDRIDLPELFVECELYGFHTLPYMVM